MPTPIAYTSKEGGKWRKWKGKDIPNKQIRGYITVVFSKKGNYAEIQNRKVHSLLFKTSQYGLVQRWDCLNGLTKGLQEFLNPKDTPKSRKIKKKFGG